MAPTVACDYSRVGKDIDVKFGVLTCTSIWHHMTHMSECCLFQLFFQTIAIGVTTTSLAQNV